MKQFSQKIFSNKAQAICHTWLALQCAGLKSRDRKSYQAALKKARDERSMVKLDDIPEIGKLQGLVNLDIQDWHGKDKVHVGIGLGRGEKRVGEALEALKKSLWIASCRADHCAQIMLLKFRKLLSYFNSTVCATCETFPTAQTLFTLPIPHTPFLGKGAYLDLSGLDNKVLSHLRKLNYAMYNYRELRFEDERD